VLVGLLLVGACSPAATTTLGAAHAPGSGPAAHAPGPAAPAPAPSLTPQGGRRAPGSRLPRPDHTLVVVMENHGYPNVIGNRNAPWLNSLPAAVMTNWHGVTHPSQPNYLAMFAGSTHGVTDNRCPVTLTGPNLASQLADAGLSFTGYSQGLPAAGSTVCRAGDYARKHNPWADFTDLPAAVNQPLTAFPSDYSALPTVAFVVPDLCHDTHNCSVGRGDRWLRDTFDGYVRWARTHNSLLVVTYDEDDTETAHNLIPTLFVGPMVVPGRYDQLGNHFTLLRTLEAFYGLPAIGHAAGRAPLTTIWR
jgi:acid phosphatase